MENRQVHHFQANLVFRFPPIFTRCLTETANAAGLSLNQWERQAPEHEVGIQ
uniref:HicB family protein n=1 Tax=Candidatus Kentrum sp. TUN TaxID=2126343 RepID=A0A450ZPL0_9GAMM|nr:MAG: hypothetical protein BECKTUN1418D_GA0071000_10374 [Candidatus Kentron sp. TUN]